MYIEQTTPEERRIIMDKTDHLFQRIQQARRILSGHLETFSYCLVDKDNPGTALVEAERLEAERLTDTLHVVEESLFNICLEYGLMIGEDYDGVEEHKESMRRVLLGDDAGLAVRQ